MYLQMTLHALVHQIRLVVLDGLSYLLRYDCDSDYLERTKLIRLIAHQLRIVAQQHSVCVSTTQF